MSKPTRADQLAERGRSWMQAGVAAYRAGKMVTASRCFHKANYWLARSKQ